MAIFTAIATAIFAGTALAGTWVVGVTAFVLSQAASFGISALLKKIAGQPEGPSFGVQGSLQSGGDIPRQFGFGRYATAGSLAWANHWGEAGGTPNAFFTQVIALADLPDHSVERFIVDGKAVTLDDTPNWAGHFPALEYRKGDKDYLWIKFYDGNQTEADPMALAAGDVDWPYEATRIGVGVCYAVLTSKVREDLFSGFPTLLVEMDGLPLFDPTDETHNEADAGTWGGDADHFPAAQIRRLLKGVTFQNKWFYGLQGMPATRLPAANWEAMIEACRLPIDGPDGEEPSYRSGGEIDVNAPIADAIEAILTTCHGRLAEYGGVYEVYLGPPASEPDFEFSDDDILSTSERSFTPFFGLADTINGVSASFPNPAESWAMKAAKPIYRTDLEEEDGDRRLMASIQFDFLPWEAQVQRVMKAAIEEGQRSRRHTFALPPKFWTVTPGAIGRYNSTRHGHPAGKLYRVDGAVDSANLINLLDLTEVDPADFAWDQEEDYTPPVDGDVGPVRPPAQAMTGWQAEAVTITSGGISRPSIEVSFDGDLDDVQFVQVQARLDATMAVTFDGTLPYGELTDDPKSVILNGTFLPATAYEVRGRFLPFSLRETEWSAWLDVTTDAVYVSETELEANLQAIIQQVRDTIPADMLFVRQELDDLSAALHSQVSTILERMGRINIGVGERYEENRASAEIALTAAADANRALSAIFLNAFAKTAAGEAESLIQIRAASIPAGALAAIELAVRAGFGSDMASAALRLIAYADTALGGFVSRIELEAAQSDIIFPSGRRLKLQAVGQTNGDAIAPIDVDGDVTADLSELEQSHLTVLDENVTVRFPTGAPGVFRYLHTFRQNGVGGFTVTFDPTVFVGEPPVIDDAADSETSVEIFIRSISPSRALMKLFGGGAVEAGTPRQFSIFPAVDDGGTPRTVWDLDVHGPLTIEIPDTFTITPIGTYLDASVDLRGAGGSSGGTINGGGSASHATEGTNSTFDTMIAGPGGRTLSQSDSAAAVEDIGPGGTAGAASGGDTNTVGVVGGEGHVLSSGVNRAAVGGDGAETSWGVTDTDAPTSGNNGIKWNGVDGPFPGVGASGSSWCDLISGTERAYATAGGGSGGRVIKAFGVGDLEQGVGYELVVGDSGSPGVGTGGDTDRRTNGGKGGPGSVIIT